MVSPKSFLTGLKGCLLFGVILIFAIPLSIVIGLWFVLNRIQRSFLLLRVKNEWLPQGKITLFVYSDEPKWKKYVESEIIPKIHNCTVILDWSKRRQWVHEDDLATKLFRNFNWGQGWLWNRENKRRIGGRALNHMAIVFKPWFKAKVFSFWKTWKDAEFGKNEAFDRMIREFLKLVSEKEL